MKNNFTKIGSLLFGALMMVWTISADAQTTITQNSSLTITSSGILCSGAGFPRPSQDNSIWRKFDLDGAHTLSGQWLVSKVSVGVGGATTPNPTAATINLYSIPNGTAAIPLASIVLIGTGQLDFSSTSPGAIIDLSSFISNNPINASTSDLVVEVFIPGQLNATSFMDVGYNALAETAPTYLSSAACGITAPTTIAQVGFPNFAMVMQVTGDVPPAGIPTASEWGLIMIALLSLSYGLVVIARDKKILATEEA